MTKSEFELYIENIEALDRMRNSLDSLTIEWETDPNVDLTVLATDINLPDVPGTRRSIETVELDKIMHTAKDLFANGSLERYTNLFKLIESGVKIIPPLMHRSIHFVDCEEIKESINKLIPVFDGFHRLNLAKHIGLKEVPILVVEIPTSYTFTKTLWEVSCTEHKILLKRKGADEIFELPLANCFGRLTASGDYFFYIH